MFQVLAGAGFGRIEGEGAQMVYLPNTTIDGNGKFGEIDEKLVVTPIAKKQIPQEIQLIVDKIGEANAAPSLNGKVPVGVLDEVENLFDRQKNNSLEECHLQQKIQQTDNSSPTHQFTNCNSTNLDVLGASAIGGSIGEFHQTPTHQENINWLVQFLTDLELEVTPHPRWNNNDELEASLNEAELKAKCCSEELEKTYPDYWERVGNALATTIERLALFE
ncbi:MAG: hypothetical protein HC820_00015 [Hydrococcus sp. RM1_1_31]|nr:hypothetical protein [Hydrococcus sp. RM1_1_31]